MSTIIACPFCWYKKEKVHPCAYCVSGRGEVEDFLMHMVNEINRTRFKVDQLENKVQGHGERLNALHGAIKDLAKCKADKSILPKMGFPR